MVVIAALESVVATFTVKVVVTVVATEDVVAAEQMVLAVAYTERQVVAGLAFEYVVEVPSSYLVVPSQALGKDASN